MIGAALLVALGLAAGPPAAAGGRESYRRDQRVAYLARAFEAVKESAPVKREEAYAHMSAMARGPCHARSDRLKAECLLTAARRYCQVRGRGELKSCLLLTDVAVSNVLAEEAWVPLERRYELMRRRGSYRKWLSAEVWQLEGRLAADFYVKAGTAALETPEALASHIDGYCLAAADQAALPWQTCAASLVWFIGLGGAEPRS